MIYSDAFLGALGRWQRGWRRDPVLRGPIATNLNREADRLPSYVREHDGSPLYRKRNLYRREDQSELVPLFMEGDLDEGSPTSWSSDLAFAEKFGGVFDDHSPNSAAGAIFRHVPTNDEVILNVPRLWEDSAFVKALESYQQRGGTEAKAIYHFRGERDQFEIVLRAPLLRSELYRLGRPTTYESLYASVGAVTDEEKATFDGLLQAASIDPFEARYLSEEATRRVATRVFEKQRARLSAWVAERTPTKPSRRRGRLRDAYELGRNKAAPHAEFLGWRRLRARGGLMEGRWSDGTVAYQGFFGRVWLW